MDALFNEMQRELSEECVETIAYADDLACIIGKNSRIVLETSARGVIEALKKWCNYHRLKISASKTVAMMVKGSMNESRLPIIKMNDQNIKYDIEHIK